MSPMLKRKGRGCLVLEHPNGCSDSAPKLFVDGTERPTDSSMRTIPGIQFIEIARCILDNLLGREGRRARNSF